ncbi:MAG: peptidylprolyl isomerase [Bacteroidota bacterium]|nr:peptidylprolyl isomerase [Bacteroidota bacterium]
MKNFSLAVFGLLLFAANATSQTLFTIGNESVSIQEFLKAYEKNNINPVKNPKELQEYLDLYIASKLKIKEAKERRLDTLPQIINDLQGLRNQLMPAYFTDKEIVNKLVRESFDRSKKDIQLAHIFISFIQNGKADTTIALNKAKEAYQKLQKGEAFASVAKAYSMDPSVARNNGNVGFITAFSLPYELENLAYKTPSGKISTIHRSVNGYHIFKNMGERKAVGKIKTAQILIAFPPDSTDMAKADAKKLADSIYTRLLKGDDFGNMATAFSNDVISAASKGLIPEFGVGEFDPAFETAVLSIPKNGGITKPFLTAHGWHIVKRLDVTPPPATQTEAVLSALKERVEESDRIQTAKDALVESALKMGGFKKGNYTNSDLWRFTDSLLDYKTFGIKNDLTSQSILFVLDNKSITAKEWIDFARIKRINESSTAVNAYNELWNEFIEQTALSYYAANIENLNPAFKEQINEFAEGNLFFEIMQEKVWNPAQADTNALKQFYNANRSKYTWKESADVILFYTSDEPTATSLQKQISLQPSNWKKFSDDQSERVVTDSGRLELTQIPSATNQPLKVGVVTQPLVNNADNTATFAYVLKLHPAGDERSFDEAKGLVINDYQAELEKRWVEDLKKRYPVKINQAALASLVK